MAPVQMAAPRPRAIVTAGLNPESFKVRITSAIATPAKPSTEPTERSIPPEAMTKVCPAAISTTGEKSCRMLAAAASEKKRGFTAENNATIAAKIATSSTSCRRTVEPSRCFQP